MSAQYQIENKVPKSEFQLSVSMLATACCYVALRRPCFDARASTNDNLYVPTYLLALDWDILSPQGQQFVYSLLAVHCKWWDFAVYCKWLKRTTSCLFRHLQYSSFGLFSILWHQLAPRVYIYIYHLIDIVKSERSELNDTFRRSEKSDSEMSLGGNKDCLCIYLVKEVLSVCDTKKWFR